MDNTVLSPAACEMPSVIRFLQAEGNGTAQIHRRLCSVNGDGSVRDLCRQLKNGRTNVHNEETKVVNRS